MQLSTQANTASAIVFRREAPQLSLVVLGLRALYRGSGPGTCCGHRLPLLVRLSIKQVCTEPSKRTDYVLCVDASSTLVGHASKAHPFVFTDIGTEVCAGVMTTCQKIIVTPLVACSPGPELLVA
eukprot:1157724-Pelagomonas_calceolata.AAC.4